MRFFVVFVLLCALCGGAFAADYRSETLSEEITWFDASEKPVRLYGVLPPSPDEPYYHRMPPEAAERVSEGVADSRGTTSGGRVRFYTDSPFVAVHARLWRAGLREYMTRIIYAGFDMYVQTGNEKPRYAGYTTVPQDFYGGHDSLIYTGSPGTVTLFMPLYGGVRELYVGVKKGSVIKEAPGYKYEKPVVFYGSSITHGAAASRNGNSYPAMLSRSLDAAFINLGFGGCALGEQAMAEYIAGLEMSAFVLDYDHNAPTAGHLRDTHYAFYKTIRKKQPELPIIMLSRPKPVLGPDEKERLEIIKSTYAKARAEGDKNVYFIAGNTLVDDYAGDAWSVDRVHPNDNGFACMAKGIEKTLKPILEKSGAR
ncbi:MAG: hypothetical protein ILO36_06715 [Abditibacteriota bacterium]|nr:hypothetical protein [Abditibacteriota bacterium]